MTRIWARRSSSSAQKVFWLLEELGVSYEQIDAGRSFGIVDQPAYLAKNPNGLVPTLEEEDGFLLWESNAILRYLAAREKSEVLYPSDIRLRANVDRWIDWTVTTAVPAINPIFGSLILNHGPKDADFIAKQVEASRKALQIASLPLRNQPYLAGASLTLADIVFGMIINRWYSLPVERPKQPVIEAYYERLLERPAYVANIVNAPPVV